MTMSTPTHPGPHEAEPAGFDPSGVLAAFEREIQRRSKDAHHLQSDEVLDLGRGPRPGRARMH
jgi:hypothetical protein